MTRQKEFTVSYVLGIRNAERTIDRCLNAIFLQNYSKSLYEVIVVDGNSTDSTLSIVKKFMREHKNIKLLHNPNKLSEGKGMSKDIGVKASRGEIIIFLDHDNIILGRNWTNQLLYPFKNDTDISASQSMLAYNRKDTPFLKYINAIGIDDPFAIPYSLVSQVTFNPKNFNLINDNYYVYRLNEKKVLYAGANGCAFKKKVLERIGGYTREVDVFSEMAKYRMEVAVSKDAKVFHDTTASFSNYLKKKARYFYGFFNSGYKYRKFNWVEKGLAGKVRFVSLVVFNLTLIVPSFQGLRQFFRTGKLFWLLHPLYLFYMTLEYCLIALFKIDNFFKYAKLR